MLVLVLDVGVFSLLPPLPPALPFLSRAGPLGVEYG